MSLVMLFTLNTQWVHSLNKKERNTLWAETFADVNFRVLKKREIFDKRFLEQISRKKLVTNSKLRFAVA